MQDELIAISGLTKRYDDFELAGFDLTVEPGSIVGFVGSNGAGKTTTIKCLLGTVFPDGGSVRLLGREVASCSPEHVDAAEHAALMQDVGFVPDACAFPDECTVEVVGRIGAGAFARWNGTVYAQLCRDFGLDARKKVKDLSRGMGMKLSLAFALAHEPRLLVLDEATAGLDPLARDQVLEVIRGFVADEQRGVLISSHITSDLEKAADRIVCIDAGRLIFDLPVDEITDLAGVAHCGAAALDALVASRAYAPGVLRAKRGAYATDVLVPNRFEFAEAFPEVPVDRASIDDYLTLTLRGEQL
ncbi:MAG: ABC transporter ATP-binding protein [Coriobacteriia bacterium]|nr:ABC transporter ATP-binding protein [Coriobacteriia bacterium]